MHNQLSSLEQACKTLLISINEDPNREGLQKTPHRFAKAFLELTEGYNQITEEIVGDAIFYHDHAEMIIVKDIEFYSLCEHHVLPFFGKATVAYIPDGKIIGLSKIPRLVNKFARRLQIQERLTREICDEIKNVLQPQGVACSIEAYHMCMMMRGVQNQSSKTITNALNGLFETNPLTRQEFFDVLHRT